VAVAAAGVALALTPVAPVGLPVMAAAGVAVLAGLTWRDMAGPGDSTRPRGAG
jgi:hypothetical protein